MDDNKQHASGGFLFGVIVGVVLALLFTTKKGREILRTLTDEGLNKFADLEDLLQEKVHEVQSNPVDDESDYIEPEEREVVSQPTPEPKAQQSKESTKVEKKTEIRASEKPVEEVSEPKHTTKRFFRKSK